MSKLKNYRLSRGVSQVAIANYLGVTGATYRKYENAPEKMTIQQGKAICDFLRCSWDDIFLPYNVK